MLEDLKEEVCEANRQLQRCALVALTWGNTSGLDRGRGLAVIKPSGVPYEQLEPAQMVVVDLEGTASMMVAYAISRADLDLAPACHGFDTDESNRNNK